MLRRSLQISGETVVDCAEVGVPRRLGYGGHGVEGEGGEREAREKRERYTRGYGRFDLHAPMHWAIWEGVRAPRSRSRYRQRQLSTAPRSDLLPSFSYLLLSSLELSDAHVYAP